MAKSTRSKVKRAFRSKKRETGVYAANEAARLQRLSARLKSSMGNDGQEAMEDGEELPVNTDTTVQIGPAESMSVDVDGHTPVTQPKAVSTHGSRGSRREQWRLSKGWDAKPKPRGANRQGSLAARRKAGRSKRRR